MSPFNSNGDEIVTTYVHNTAAINQFHKLNRSDWIRFFVCYSGHSTPTKRQFIEGSSLEGLNEFLCIREGGSKDRPF